MMKEQERQLLKEAAERIRSLALEHQGERGEFLLNLAAVVELMDPAPLRAS